MNYIGLSCGFHDASLAVVNKDGEIVYTARSSEFSGIPNDKNLDSRLVLKALEYGDNEYELHYYENPLLKYLRQLRAGERPGIKTISASYMIGRHNHKLLNNKPIHTHKHHLTHAAGGFQTSKFDRATVVVIDAIGEFDTITIWSAEYKNNRAQYRRLYSQTYPDSIGLFYSAMTKQIGLTPLQDEYKLMKYSEHGNRYSECTTALLDTVVNSVRDCTFNDNLHIGLNKSVSDSLLQYSVADVAASTQYVTEQLIYSVMQRAKSFNFSNNLVYSGGVALNSIANNNLSDFFDNIHIMSDPGDSGSSIGACALAYGHRLTSL